MNRFCTLVGVIALGGCVSVPKLMQDEPKSTWTLTQPIDATVQCLVLNLGNWPGVNVTNGPQGHVVVLPGDAPVVLQITGNQMTMRTRNGWSARTVRQQIAPCIS